VLLLVSIADFHPKFFEQLWLTIPILILDKWTWLQGILIVEFYFLRWDIFERQMKTRRRKLCRCSRR
jgi:hypothetical protein